MRRKRISVHFLISCLIVFTTWAIGAYTGVQLVALIGAVIAGIVIAEADNRTEYIILLALLLTLFQNFILGFFAHLGDSSKNLSLITQVPFLYVVTVFLVLLVSRRLKITSVSKSMFVFFVVIGLGFIHGGNFTSILLQVRNLTLFYFFFEIVVYSIQNRTARIWLNRHIVGLGVFGAITGWILLIGGFRLYSMLGIANVYIAKGVPGEGIFELPGRFTTDVFGIHMVRMGGLYFEPVVFSYFLGAAFLCAFFFQWTESRSLKILVSTFLGISLIFTGGKGGMLAVSMCLLISFITNVFVELFPRLSRTQSFWIAIVISIIVLVAFSRFYGSEYAGPSKAHFDTITNTWATIKQSPFGHGLAQGGFNTEGSMEEISSSGAESALMTIGYQLGIQGMVMLAVSLIAVSRYVSKHNFPRVLGNQEQVISMAVPVVLYSISIFQLNTFSTQAVLPFFALVSASASLFPYSRVGRIPVQSKDKERTDDLK